MRITFHLGEDEVSRFEIASHVSGGAMPGVRSPGRRCSGTAGRCGKTDQRRGSRGGRSWENASGVPTSLRGRAPRAVKAKKPEGRGLRGEGGPGRGGSRGVGEWGESRLPLLPRECAASAAPELPLQVRAGSPLYDRKDAATWGRDASQP